MAQPMFLSRLLVVTAEHPLGPDVVHAGLLEAGECRTPRRNRSRSGNRRIACDDALIQQGEVAGIVRDRDVGEIVEDPVERLVGELHEQGAPRA